MCFGQLHEVSLRLSQLDGCPLIPSRGLLLGQCDKLLLIFLVSVLLSYALTALGHSSIFHQSPSSYPSTR